MANVAASGSEQQKEEWVVEKEGKKKRMRRACISPRKSAIK